MHESLTDRQWGRVEVPAKAFSRRMSQVNPMLDSTNTHHIETSVYSRLAIIHRVAKQYALESLPQMLVSTDEVEIEEITNPPLYEPNPDDEPVLIQFSYPR